MTFQGKSVSAVGPRQLREKNLFFAPPYSKCLQRVTTLRTFYSCLRRTVPSFLIQFQVERKEMKSTFQHFVLPSSTDGSSKQFNINITTRNCLGQSSQLPVDIQIHSLILLNKL